MRPSPRPRRPRGRDRAPVMLDGSPVQRLRPRTAGRLLDGAFEVVRFRPLPMAALLVTTWIPAYVASLVLGGYGDLWDWVWARLTGHSPAELGIVDPRLAAAGVLALTLGEMLTGVGVGFLVVAWVHGDDPSARAVLARLARCLPRAVLAWSVTLFVKVGTLGLTAPALALVGPVVGAGGQGPVAAIRRSLLLTRRIRGAVASMFVLSPLLGILVAIAVDQSDRQGLLPITAMAEAVGALAAAALTAWRASLWALVHVDAQVVGEGLDLRLELERVAP